MIFSAILTTPCSLFLSAAEQPAYHTVGQNRLDCCMIKADEQSPVPIISPKHPQDVSDMLFWL